MPLFIDFCFVFGSQKPNFPYTISYPFIWRMCVCVSSRQETMCLPRLVHYVCNKNVFKKRTEEKRRLENSQTAQTESFFFRLRPKSSRCRFLSTMKYSVRLSFRAWHTGDNADNAAFWLLRRLRVVVATCVREYYVMKCVAVVNMTCACFSKRWWDVELVLSEPLICSLPRSLRSAYPSVRSKFEIIIALLTQNPI